MRTHKPRISALQEIETRPPHQRPVTENPQVFIALVGTYVHRGGELDHGVDGTGELRSPNRAAASMQPEARQGRRNAVFGRF